MRAGTCSLRSTHHLRLCTVSTYVCCPVTAGIKLRLVSSLCNRALSTSSSKRYMPYTRPWPLTALRTRVLSAHLLLLLIRTCNAMFAPAICLLQRRPRSDRLPEPDRVAVLLVCYICLRPAPSRRPPLAPPLFLQRAPAPLRLVAGPTPIWL